MSTWWTFTLQGSWSGLLCYFAGSALEESVCLFRWWRRLIVLDDTKFVFICFGIWNINPCSGLWWTSPLSYCDYL